MPGNKATDVIPEESAIVETVETEEETEKAREERKATGKSVAIIIFLSVMSLAIYHVIQQKTTVLAGVLVPALILFTYLFFVIHVSSREKEKRRQELESTENLELSVQNVPKKPELHKKISNVSTPSLSSLPSTSGMSNSSKTASKQNIPRSSSVAKMDPTKMYPAKKPFVKAPSQSHIQVKNMTHIMVEHERKKLKKSRSFDKANTLFEIPKK